MNKSTRNTLIGAGIASSAIAAFGAVSHTVTKKLMSVGMDRQAPAKFAEARPKFNRSPALQGAMVQLEQAGEILQSRPTEIVETISGDGIRLVGHLYRCENAERTIIAMHGWRSAWYRDFGIISEFWHNHGCNVLYAEQRAQGESEGEYMGFGLIERYDCISWINFLNENGFKNAPIYLAGVSMGAATVMMAAGLELPANVHGVLADCGYTSPHAIWEHILKKNLHLSYGNLRKKTIDDMFKKNNHIDTITDSCTDAMKSCKTPVIFIHGTDDHMVPVEMTYENYQACAAPKRLLIVPGAEHGMSYLVDKAGYEAALMQFWADYDKITT